MQTAGGTLTLATASGTHHLTLDDVEDEEDDDEDDDELDDDDHDDDEDDELLEGDEGDVMLDDAVSEEILETEEVITDEDCRLENPPD